MESYGQMQTVQGSMPPGLIGGNVQTSPNTPPTLMRAMSSLDELNKRIIQVRSITQEIAHAIGGPYPQPAEQERAPSPPQSAVCRLNESVDTAHQSLRRLEEALGAISRALGA